MRNQNIQFNFIIGLYYNKGEENQKPGILWKFWTLLTRRELTEVITLQE